MTGASSIRRAFLIVVPLLGIALVSRGQAQSVSDGTTVPGDSTARLKNTLAARKSDLASLERMLDALNGVDSVYLTHCPHWVILDEDLRYRISRLFQMRYTGRVADTAIIVTTNPDQSQIVRLQSGRITMGRRDVHVYLGDSLYSAIVHGDYPRQDIVESPVVPRNPMLFGYTPRFAALSASAFGATLLFNDGWGIQAMMGDEDVGYHFWSTGSLQILALFEQLKLGVIVPFTFGQSPSDPHDPLAIRERKLTGGKGVSIGYDYLFGSEQLTASFKVGEIRGLTNPDLIAAGNSIYSLHTVAQLAYSRQESIDRGRHIFAFKGGIGYHQIAEAAPLPDGTLAPTEKHDFVSPLLRADYVHQGDRLYGAGIQYYSAIIFANCWVELVKDFLFVDLKYYAPVGRAPKPWEQSYFFMISPRLQVVY